MDVTGVGMVAAHVVDEKAVVVDPGVVPIDGVAERGSHPGKLKVSQTLVSDAQPT